MAVLSSQNSGGRGGVQPETGREGGKQRVMHSTASGRQKEAPLSAGRAGLVSLCVGGRRRAGRLQGHKWVPPGSGRAQLALQHEGGREAAVRAGAAERAGARRRRDEGPVVVVPVVGGAPRGRAGEAERQPLPAVEEEAGGAEQGLPEPLLARGRRRRRRRRPGQGQGAALRRHPEGGLRGAHRQVRLLHHRHDGPQGDRLSVPGRELLERLHHHGPHRLPEQARHPGLQEPPGGRRAGRRRHPRQAPGQGPLSHPRPRPAGRAEPKKTVPLDDKPNRASWIVPGQDTNEGKQQRMLAIRWSLPGLMK